LSTATNKAALARTFRREGLAAARVPRSRQEPAPKGHGLRNAFLGLVVALVVVALVAPFQGSSQTGAAISGAPTCAILQAAINSNEACPGS